MPTFAQEGTIVWTLKDNILYLSVKPKIGGTNPIPPPKPIDPGGLKSFKKYLKKHNFEIIKNGSDFFMVIIDRKVSGVKFFERLIKTEKGYILPKYIFESAQYKKDDDFVQSTKQVFESIIFSSK